LRLGEGVIFWEDLYGLHCNGVTASGVPCMPHFLLTFGYASRPAVSIVIIDAPSMFEARMTAVVRRFILGGLLTAS
jgi:hypothetical protein